MRDTHIHRTVAISDLVLLERNPRKITGDQMKKLCDSLEKDPDFFKLRPVLVHEVDGIYNVYAGNQRVRAAQKLKWKDVPCIVEENLSEELIKDRVIKDNMHMGEWIWDMLANEFEIESLYEAGFTEQSLLGHTEFKGIVQVEEKEEKEPKGKVAKMCPQCGHEF